jgi:methyltransferase (TIGR00027 family)
VRADTPSFTAAGVALMRSRLDRPGDADDEVRLTAALLARMGDLPDARQRRRSDGEFANFLTARTHFFDNAVLDAIADGVQQIVILGAGYDARALRFRTPGVRFFEVDHPATQRAKRELLAEIDAGLDAIRFVAADFTEPGLDDALLGAGFDTAAPAQFLCEGVLRYLPEDSWRELLHVPAAVSAPASRLATSVSTHDQGDSPPDGRRGTDEPVLTVPPRATALEWIAAAGWTVTSIEDVATLTGAPARRGRMLVRASRN